LLWRARGLRWRHGLNVDRGRNQPADGERAHTV